jgi:hypothetical protein
MDMVLFCIGDLASELWIGGASDLGLQPSVWVDGDNHRVTLLRRGSGQLALRVFKSVQAGLLQLGM